MGNRIKGGQRKGLEETDNKVKWMREKKEFCREMEARVKGMGAKNSTRKWMV